MAWIPHLMVLDDDPRVLESLVPSFVNDLAAALGRTPAAGEPIRRGDPSTRPASIKVTAHGYESSRLDSYRFRPSHHLHLHLVRERGGRFDLARKLLNDQLFAVVVSDLRFSDDAGGLRAGQLFVDEAARVHPEVQGLLYSAYPRPEGFPAERFLRKGGDGAGSAPLAEAVVRALARHLAEPAVAAFSAAMAEQGLIYQSEAFGSTLAQLFDLARLFGAEPQAVRPATGAKARRPLPALLLDGASGTGKRGLAEVFRAATDRRKAPLTVASCNELTNETLLRSILFGHKRGAFTDAREDRPGLVAAAGKGFVLLDDFHRLPDACSSILHSFLEDGEYSRLGEEEARRQADAAIILTVETEPWAERRRAGNLPLAFLARVERLPLLIPPLRDRPDDIEAQARWLCRAVSAELGADVELADDALDHLKAQTFRESNSRELRNLIERAILRHGREVDLLDWSHLQPFLVATPTPPAPSRPGTPPRPAGLPAAPATAAAQDWQRRLRSLATKMLAKARAIPAEAAGVHVDRLFDAAIPPVWDEVEAARQAAVGDAPDRPIPLPVWEDIWRCYAVSRLGGPTPAERVLGIPANTLRQWINDRESR